jgi:hypothetical protein
VTPVCAVMPVRPDPQGQRFHDTAHRPGKAQAGGTTGRAAASAGTGFAAHLLMEAGAAGHDPHAAQRARKAYAGAARAAGSETIPGAIPGATPGAARGAVPGRVRLVA